MKYQQLTLLETAETPTTPLLTERPPRSVNHLDYGFTHKVYEMRSRGHHYYRYVANNGHETVHSLHIPGGNTSNKIAQKRAKLVQHYIDCGVSLVDIINLIESWQLRDKR